MQKWEYLEKSTWREYKGLFRGWGEWQDKADLQRLGEAGWELVSTHTVSSIQGVGFAGLTTNVVYMFKRPKEEQPAG